MKPVNKNILITGVSTGIGWGIAQEFIRKGYQVFGSVRREADAKNLQKQWGSSFTPLLFDVTDLAAVRQAVEQVTDQLDNHGLAGLVNNAGIAIGGPLLHQPIEQIRHHFEVNVIGLMQVTQAFLPLLGARPNHSMSPGRILNISSVGGQIAGPFIGAYHGSKFALEGLSHTLRRELQFYGVQVIIIGPGAVNTPIWDKGVDATPYKNTQYGTSFQKFLEYFAAQGKKGYSPQQIGQQVVRIFETPKPKTRYALVPGKFQNWILPRLLPDWLLDRIIGRANNLLPAT